MKKLLKRGLSIFLAITIIFSSAYVGLSEVDFGGIFLTKAKAASISNLTFTLSSDGTYYSVTDCNTSASGSLTIPSIYNGKSVAAIGNSAFWACDGITSVTIPSSVTSIGSSAFRNCTNLTSITIPDSITHIGRSAFYKSGYYNNSNSWINNVLYIGDFLIEANSSLYGNYAIKEGTKLISAYAFNCTNLTSITIPDSVKFIEEHAFRGCKGLTSVTIPNSVTSIGDWAFGECESLISVIIPNSVTSIAYCAFTDCTSLQSVTIPSSVTSIDEYAFDCCTSLNAVYITDIAKWCNIDFYDYESNPLYYAKNLYLNGKLVTDLVIPNGVTSIGDYAFTDCTNFASVTIPDSVSSIGFSAFTDCTNLNAVYISDVAKWCNIDFNSNPLYYAKNLYLNGKLVTDLVIPNGVTSIGFSAFYNCTSLTSVTIPDSVTSIGYSAFNYCENLKYVFCPDETFSFDTKTIDDYNSKLLDAKWHYGATDHTVVKDGAIKPTCTTTGKTEGSHCSVCDAVITAQETIPANGHTLSDWVVDVEPTCIEMGSKYQTCSVCDDVLTEEIPATGHLNTEWIIEKNPACTGTGYKDEWCLDCGEIINTEEIPATGHLNTEWITEKEPTCDVAGYKDEWCLDCGELINSEEIPATGHSCADWIIDVAPTCTEGGSKHQICSACKENVTEVIPSLGHNYSTEWTTDVAPTCTEEGSKSHHCTACGEKTDITVVESLGHSYSEEWTIDIAPTCTEEGSKSHHCTVCGDKADVTVVETLGHIYSEEWTIDIAPTCTEAGSKSHHCTGCDKEKADVIVIEPLGHNYELHSIADEHPHINTFRCSRCPEIKEEESYSEKCGICNFTYTDNGDGTCKITGYIGNSVSMFIPASIDGKTVANTNTGAFKNNTTLISVKIEDGVQGIGSLAFLGCSSLSKAVIPASVTSIGTKAFYNCASGFTIYCYRDSYAMQYAIDNSLNYVIMDIGETSKSTIDYTNNLIYTEQLGVTSLDDIIYTPATSAISVTASLVSGENEYLGTGSVVSVVDNGVTSKYTIIVDGDTNGDGVCDVLDCAQMALVANGLKTMDGAYALAGDSNSDNIIDTNDYQSIVNKALAF